MLIKSLIALKVSLGGFGLPEQNPSHPVVGNTEAHFAKGAEP